jgi:hypothetical protein
MIFLAYSVLRLPDELRLLTWDMYFMIDL